MRCRGVDRFDLQRLTAVRARIYPKSGVAAVPRGTRCQAGVRLERASIKAPAEHREGRTATIRIRHRGRRNAQ